MKKKLFFPTLLFLIFIFALLIRLYRIDALPIYADETGHYVLFHQILDKNVKPAVWLYNQLHWRTFTFTWLFGLTPMGVRSASALYGALISIAAFFFSLSISKNKKVALISSILIGVLPWSYMISRLAHTSVLIELLLILISSYFFLTATKSKHYLIGLFFLFLAATYYPTMIFITPIAALLTFYYLAKALTQKQRRTLLLSAILVALVGTAYMLKRYRLLVPGSRGPDLAIWRDINTTYDTDRFRALTWNSLPSAFSFSLPPEQLANKLFFNRITANFSIFAKNYLSFFSPDWLFLKGDAILRHSTGMVGVFFPFLMPFMLYGAFRFFKLANLKTRNFFLVWILVSPIPAAITKDGAGYLLRVVTMLPFLTYFCALGIVGSFSFVRKKWRWPYGIALALIGIYSAYYFFYGYFHVYPALSARSYEYGFKELSQFQVKNGNQTMLIVWDGYYPFYHFVFWQNIPYSEFKKVKEEPIVIGESTFWKTLSNLYFSAPKSVNDFKTFASQYKPVYIVLPDKYFVKYPEELLKLTKENVLTINYPDKTKAFSIYSLP